MAGTSRKTQWNAFGRNILAWGLVHVGDRFGEPLCRIKAMSAPSHNVDDLVTCFQCIALEVERGQEG